MNEGKEVIAVCKQCNVGVVFLTVCLFVFDFFNRVPFFSTFKRSPYGKVAATGKTPLGRRTYKPKRSNQQPFFQIF